MASSLSSLIPAYLASRMEAKMNFGIKTFGPARKASYEREPWPMPWEFKVARACEVAIVCLVLASIILAAW